MSQPAPVPVSRRRPLTTALVLAGVVFGMAGLSFAAVPLYRMFCQVTGYGGTTQRAESAPAHALDRMITVRFDANVSGGLGWNFAPEVREVRLRVGEPGQVAFLAESRRDDLSHGTATFNVTPEQVGAYFTKIDCFCFTEQTLKPGERIDMPVVFFVDPAIADDPTLDYIDSVTLSYTFYPAGGTTRQPLAAVAPPGGATNTRM